MVMMWLCHALSNQSLKGRVCSKGHSLSIILSKDEFWEDFACLVMMKNWNYWFYMLYLCWIYFKLIMNSEFESFVCLMNHAYQLRLLFMMLPNLKSVLTITYGQAYVRAYCQQCRLVNASRQGAADETVEMSFERPSLTSTFYISIKFGRLQWNWSHY